MSESPHSTRVRFFNAMAVIALIVCVIAIVVFYGIGPGNLGGPNAAAPTTSSRTEPRRTPPTHPERPAPTRYNPFIDLTGTNPRLRELALRSRPPVEAWLSDPRTTPELRAEAAEQIRKAFADEDPDVRLAAAEFVSTVRAFPEVKPKDAVPVWEAFLTDKDEERRMKAATQLWEKHAHAEAGKVLVRVVKNRAAEAKLRTRAAQARTDDPTFARPDGMTAALDAILAEKTENKSVRWCAFDQFKKARNRGEAMPATHRQTLLKLAEEADPELGYAAVKELTIDLRKSNPLSDELRPTLLKLVEARTTAAELRAAAYDALLAAKPDADTRRVAEKLLDDADAPADMRAKAFDLLFTEVKAGQVPDTLRPLVAKMAADADTHIDLRIRSFRLLNPASDGFGKQYPELAAMLEKAVTDGKAKMEFRTFAAGFYKPDTAEKFATAVEVMSKDGGPLHSALVTAIKVQFEESKRIPKEWVTAKLAERMAGCSSGGGVHAAEGDRLFADALFAAGKDVIPALAAGLNERNATSIRKRNLTVLLKFGADAKPAADAVFPLLLSEEVTADEKKLAAELIAAFGPEETRKRLTAKDTPLVERATLLKQLKFDAKARLALFTDLLGHELREVRVWAAEEVGKIGPDAKAAILKLVEQLKADVAATKKAGTQPGHGPFVEALAAIGPDCLPAVTDLTADAEPMVRVAAAEVFGYLGAEVRSKATPLLRKLIEEDKDETVKQSALHALGQVNPKEAEKLGWTPPQARRPDPEQVPVYVDRPVPVYRDPLPAYTSPKPSMPTYKPYTPPYRPVYIPLYRPLYIPRR